MQPASSAPTQPDSETKTPDEPTGQVRKNNVNATAYRIFKLLQWLTETPLSVDALNERFVADPLIGKKLSSDSVWLYINTLKMLGCKIRRPMASNNYCYELTHHPFGLMLDEEDIETLIQAKAYAQTQFSPQEMLALDRFLKKILTRNTQLDSEESIEQLFEKSRSLDYEAFSTQIALLEQWILEKQLLELSYQSPVSGLKTMQFLPCELVYERGLVYVKGDQAEKSGLSLLRVERIQQARPVENEPIRQALLQCQQELERVSLKIFVNTPGEFEPLDMDEDVTFVDADATSHMALTLYTRDFFLLKQRLLEQGRPFQILSPAWFYRDMRETLAAMQTLYQEDADGHG